MTLEDRTMINVDETGFNLSMREAQGRSKMTHKGDDSLSNIRGE